MSRSAASAIPVPAGGSLGPRRSTSTPTGRPSMSHTIQHPSEAVAAAVRADGVPYPLAKRAVDRTVAAFFVVLLSPLLLLALAVLAADMAFVLRDRGRWLYREQRISRGREFEVL